MSARVSCPVPHFWGWSLLQFRRFCRLVLLTCRVCLKVRNRVITFLRGLVVFDVLLLFLLLHWLVRHL